MIDNRDLRVFCESFGSTKYSYRIQRSGKALGWILFDTGGLPILLYQELFPESGWAQPCRTGAAHEPETPLCSSEGKAVMAVSSSQVRSLVCDPGAGWDLPEPDGSTHPGRSS